MLLLSGQSSRAWAWTELGTNNYSSVASVSSVPTPHQPATNKGNVFLTKLANCYSIRLAIILINYPRFLVERGPRSLTCALVNPVTCPTILDNSYVATKSPLQHSRAAHALGINMSCYGVQYSIYNLINYPIAIFLNYISGHKRQS